MALLFFLVKAIGISMSGVLMPGPVTAVTVAKGAQKPAAGAMVAIGHGIVEFPLMFILAFTIRVANIFSIPAVRITIGLLGGAILLWMAVDMLRAYKSIEVGESKTTYSALTAGIFLSMTNPYFLLFWATVGSKLILGALAFGFMGFVLFAILHWSADLVWYSFLSGLTYRGGKFFGRKLQQYVFVICGLALLYFGGGFITDAISVLLPAETMHKVMNAFNLI